MRFPATLTFVVRSRAEYDLMIDALNERSTQLLNTDDPSAVSYTEAIETIKVKEVGGDEKSLPDAYIEVGGKRVGQGSTAEMSTLFSSEIAAHSAVVVMFQRDRLTYRQVKARKPQR